MNKSVPAKHITSNFSDFLIKSKKEKQLGKKEIEASFSLLKKIFEEKRIRTVAKEIEEEAFFVFGKKLLSEQKHRLKKKIILFYLDIFRSPEFLEKIYLKPKWEKLVVNLILEANYTIKSLFEIREKYYTHKPLFKYFKNEKLISITWKEVKQRVSHYSSAINTMLKGYRRNEKIVSFLCTNSLEMAYFDIACITGGIINVMIPANSVESDIAHILNETKTLIIIAGNEKQLSKIKLIKKELHFLKKVILLEGKSAEDWVISLEEFCSDYCRNATHSKVNIKVSSTASVMYTSGTTGKPKGIVFSHLNLIYKRFCRAMALPKIGDEDTFLAYLPLYHTFGRYLEMMGAIFWGAEYVFMENPSLKTMIDNMQKAKPTIFISIPKKWIQLYEYIEAYIGSEESISENNIAEFIKRATGGKLRWGLSAAGYLSPNIFEFFQRYEIQLMSGFGMTEATGGITMTPPGKYKFNSLGKALPGIKIKLSDDGELLIKGEYVMSGYFHLNKKDIFDDKGWLPTGDIMKIDKENFIEIVDRKKDIYKNIKGETIAPQRIESFFYDFEFVKQVFLVGDHQPFNTVLIYPDFSAISSTSAFADGEHQQEYFSSIIGTINRFLAPYERILDFRIIDRDFEKAKGEVTEKNTYKRNIIITNFSNIISEMYQKNYIEFIISDIKLRIPNWFLREKGCLSSNIKIIKDKLIFTKLKIEIKIKHIEKNIYQIGNYIYEIKNSFIDFQSFITNPLLWAGNNELYNFAGEAIIQWQRQHKTDTNIIPLKTKGIVEVSENDILKMGKIISAEEKSVYALHLSLILLQSNKHDAIGIGMKHLRGLIINESSFQKKIVSSRISVPHFVLHRSIKEKLFLLALNMGKIETIFSSYLKVMPKMLNEKLVKKIVALKFDDTFLLSIDKYLGLLYEKFKNKDIIRLNMFSSVFYLLSEYGIAHPRDYEKIRQTYVLYQLKFDFLKLIEEANNYRTILRIGFRKWLGENNSVAIDIETGEEYGWEDVITFEESISGSDKERLFKAIKETQILRETIFLFTGKTLLRLNDILPNGINVVYLRDFSEATSYKLTIQSRNYGIFEIVLNLNQTLSKKDILSEVNWFIQSGSRYFVQELVKDFGGYWEEYDLWSSKFTSGKTVEKYLTKQYEDLLQNKTRLLNIWEFFVWNASAAYFNFWRLTDYKLILTKPSVANFIIPEHDYQIGTKVVSFSERREFVSLPDTFYQFYQLYISKTLENYPELYHEKIWNFIFSGLINTLGEKLGLKILYQFEYELEFYKDAKERESIIYYLDIFLKQVKDIGFMPKPLYFAIRRFNRWITINIKASLEAQAKMLIELYETYHLKELEDKYSHTRTRFFLETVFANSDLKLQKMLKEIIRTQHEKVLSEKDRLLKITEIQSEFELNEKEKFFIARLGYIHLKPEDSVELIKVDTVEETNLVVKNRDNKGRVFYIRNPISPKEVSRLQQLFREEHLDVNFKPNHLFLIAVAENRFIMGGLFYSIIDDKTLHIEKIVVGNQYRATGISKFLMEDFFSRSSNQNYRFVTTGFFRPEYFSQFGFNINSKYSGLLKKL